MDSFSLFNDLPCQSYRKFGNLRKLETWEEKNKPSHSKSDFLVGSLLSNSIKLKMFKIQVKCIWPLSLPNKIQ